MLHWLISLFFAVVLFHSETRAANLCQDLFTISDERAGLMTIGEQTLRYMTAGDPSLPPILFIHGAPGQAENWTYFLKHPQLKNRFHLIAVDRTGYGGSDRGLAESSLQKQAVLVSEALKLNHSSKPAIVVGYSFGGPIAARLAIEAPQKVSGLILVSSLASPQYLTTKWYFQFVKYIVQSLQASSRLKVFFEEIAPLKNELEEMKPLWQGIHSKVVVIHGADDTSVPVDNADFITEQLSTHPKFVKRILPQTGHQVLKKQPDEIVKAIELLIQD